MKELQTIKETIMYLTNISDVLEYVRRKIKSQSLIITQKYLVSAIEQLKLTKVELEKSKNRNEEEALR